MISFRDDGGFLLDDTSGINCYECPHDHFYHDCLLNHCVCTCGEGPCDEEFDFEEEELPWP